MQTFDQLFANPSLEDAAAIASELEAGRAELELYMRGLSKSGVEQPDKVANGLISWNMDRDIEEGEA